MRPFGATRLLLRTVPILKNTNQSSIACINHARFFSESYKGAYNQSGFYQQGNSNANSRSNPYGSSEERSSYTKASFAAEPKESVESIASGDKKGTFYPFEDEFTNESFCLTDKLIRTEPFDQRAIEILQKEIDEKDVQIRPDGFIYLPEIKYRHILSKAFGPGGWCLVPRGRHSITGDFISREYWLFCHGKFVAAARGFAMTRGKDYSDVAEAAKSNALVRCCKDLSISQELWDPVYARKWKESFAESKYDGKKSHWIKKASE